VTAVTSADTSIVVTNGTTTPALQLASLSTIAANEGGTVPVANIAAGLAGQVLQGTGPTYAYPPGYEIGYSQITTSVTVSSSTESAGTAVISPGALTFDGGAVMVEFFSPAIFPGSSVDVVIVCMFESTVEIGRLLAVENSASGVAVSGVGRLKFTPSAGAHTYTLTAFRASVNGSISAGAGGTATYVPAFVRFTKV
jgi:hypothetical protein